MTTANIHLCQGRLIAILAARSSHGSRVTQCKLWLWSFLSEADKFVRNQFCRFLKRLFWLLLNNFAPFPSPGRRKRKREPGNEVDRRDWIFSDQLEFSPNNITEYIIKRKGHENYKMSHHQRENTLIFYKILSTSFWKKRMGYRCGEFTCGYWAVTGWLRFSFHQTELSCIIIRTQIWTLHSN